MSFLSRRPGTYLVTTNMNYTVPHYVILDLKEVMSLSLPCTICWWWKHVSVSAAAIHHVVSTSPPPTCDILQVMGRSIPNFRAKTYVTQQSKQ
jgi:hypothetical protein